MSDTVKLVVWIAVAVIVIGIIVWLFVNAGRRREVEARRFEAGELRARVEERRPEVQGSQDRASVTAAMAEDARAEAERTAAEAKQRADEARRLEQQAEQHRATAESARAEHAGLEREADRVDPDVRTDDAGYRLDDDGNRLPGQEDPSRRGAPTEAAGAGAAGAGAAAFAGNHDEDDDEDDLADAENPFAPAGSAAGPDEETAEEARTSRYEEPAWEPSDPGVGHSPDATAQQTAREESAQQTAREETAREDTETLDAGSGYAEDEPGDAGADSDDTMDGDPVDDQTNDELTAQQTSDPDDAPASDSSDSATDTLDAGTDEGGRDDGVPSQAQAADDEDRVDVPALADRDDVVAEGGTPAGDPGDHRGQPWATTPGQRGPGDSEEPADEGTDVDMAPHSHESDEVESVDEPAGSTAEEPRGQEAEPATDVAEAAYPGDDDAQTPTAEGGDTAYAGGSTDESAQQEDSTSSGRRVSAFDEVVDGGYGLGSAAPIGDGAQPLGHAVKGTREGSTFLGPDDEGYDDNEPDVWFYNEEAARRAGFTKRGE